MYLSAEVENEQVIRETFNYLYYHISFERFSNIVKEIFLDYDIYLKDWVGLSLYNIRDARLIPMLEEIVNKEKNNNLKKNLQQVLDHLNKIIP
jgi:hypothetical protein